MKARKYFCLLLAVLLLALCGCSQKDPAVLENQQYAIRKTGEELYLDFVDNTYGDKAGNNGIYTSASGYKITFPTVAKMKECIEKGQFTEAQLIGMQIYEKAANGKVAVCDTKKLYDIRVPEGTVLKELSWKGSTYNFLFGNEDIEGRLYIDGRKDTFEFQRDQYNEDKWGPYFEEISRERDESRNADVVYYTAVKNPSLGVKKKISYTYEEPGLEIHFDEVYRLNESETVPKRLEFWGYCENQPFWGYMFFKDVPDHDVITSLRVVPHVETEVS